MSTKFEKQVSLPSGNSTKPRQATAQQVLLETTTNNLENTTNNNKEMDTIINNNSNNNINVNSNVINNNCNNTNTTTCNDGIESKDEVDFVRTKTYPPPTLITSKNDNTNNQKCSIMKKLTSTNMSNLYNDCEVKSSLKSSLSTLEKFSFFTLGRNHKNNHHHINNQNQNNQQQNSNNNNNNNNNNNHLININLNNENNNDIDNHNKTSSTKQHSTLKKSNSDHQMLSIKHKFGKSASIARLLGHTYNTKKVENELLKYKNNNSNCNNEMLTNGGNHSNFNSINKCEQKLLKKNFKTNFGNNTSNYTNTQNRNIERFQMCTNNEDDLTAINLTNLHSNNNTNNSNNYNTSTSYNNYNTKNKTKLNQTKQNSINNNNNIINSNCNCISQNEYKNNSNFNENKSHNNNKCNCNNNNNDNNNNKTQISNNNNNMNNNSNGNNEVNIQDFQEDHYNDISAKAFRTISRSLGKLWWKRTHSVEISAPDPEYKVSYLGNVLTGWAKGEGCVEKPLNTLWRNYSQNHKPDVIMRVRVCASGLKATTRQHGLTEYWANRITHCCSPKNYPKVFCWIYRHEGRKLKHELRCHAILCSKESIAQEICNTLRENLDRALHDFKREKILKQNARLSLANSVYENPSLPRRKILLSVGGNNYRPPMERSKSAPKLMAIEEAIGEEEGEEIEQTNEPEMPSCCQKDSLYPAMTLGRRRCRRGHSIRRTGKAYKISFGDNGKMINLSNNNCLDVIGDRTKDLVMNNDDKKTLDNEVYLRRYCHNENNNDDHNNAIKSKSTTSLGSDDDDLEKLLSHNNYDTSSPLAGELLSYFDMKLNAKTSSLTDLSESINNDDNDDNLPNNYINNNDNSNGNNTSDDQILYEASLTTDPCPRPRATLSLENLDNCCDGCESDCNIHIDFDDEEDELYYRQTAILNLLHRNSMRKLANLSMSSDDSGDSIEKSNHNHHHHHHHHRHQQHNMDSDEGSISSGCETASTVTANCEDTSLKYINDDKQQITNTSDELTINNKSNSNNSNNNSNNQIQDSLSNDNKITEVKISNKTLTFMRANHLKSPKFINNHYSNDCNGTNIMKGQTNNQISNYHSRKNFSSRKLMTANTTTTTTTTATTNGNGDISDSEFSDESGYVEFQDQIIPKRKSENEYHHNQHLSLSTSSTSSSTASMITTTNQYTNNNSSNKKN